MDTRKKNSGSLITSLAPLMIGLILHTTAEAGPANYRVDLGIEALKAGDYKTAQQWLVSAHQQGATHPDIQLALGLSAYYLGQLDNAKNYLNQAASGSNRYEAAYYLGEINRNQGDLRSAQSWYEVAASQYEDIEIQKAADDALIRLRLLNLSTESFIDEPSTTGRYALVSLESSYLDGLIDPNDGTDTDAQDTSTTLLVAGGINLPTHAKKVNWLGGVSYYTEKYAAFSVYDVDALSLHMGLSRQQKESSLQARIGYTHYELAGIPYLNQAEFRLENKKNIRQNLKLITTGRLTSISSETDNYKHSAGKLYGLSAEIRGGTNLSWRAGLSARRENRGSQLNEITIPATGELATAVTAYSKDWIKLYGRLSWKVSDKWHHNISASWRTARHQDDEQYLSNNEDEELTSLRRQTERVTLKAEMSYALTKNLDAHLGYQFLSDNANIDDYDFTSHRLSAGINVLF